MIHVLSLVFGIAGLMVSSVFVWPMVTKSPMPGPLAQIREMVLKTRPGADVAKVLGDQTVNVEQIQIEKVPEQVFQATSKIVQERAVDTMWGKAVDQVIYNWEAIPDTEKARIKSQVCK